MPTQANSNATTTKGSSPAAPPPTPSWAPSACFGFGSPAASTLPYAELLTEVCLVDGRFVASHPHALDEGREPGPSSSVDLTPWLDSPSVHELIGRIREVRDA